MRLNTEEIRNMQARRRVMYQGGIDAVVDKCYHKIRAVVSTNRRTTSCILELPEFVIGYAMYDFTECVIHVKRHLESSGYHVTYIFPRMLVVSWEDHRESALMLTAELKPSGKVALSF